MSPVARGIVALFALVCGSVAVALFAVVGGWDPTVGLSRWVALAVQRPWGTGALGGLLVFVGAAVLWLALPAAQGPRATRVKETELGEVAVSLDAVRGMVTRAAREVRGVRDVHARVRSRETGVEVLLDLAIHPDHSIPDLGEAVQRQVEGYLKGFLGVNVASVRVAVHQVVRELPRVE
ncbi:alkaline shock response membrane anchor protein AmaP [Limnochorda pilosa]|uniref:Alkaline shock response membrane anchor protein AmaP n=1 Tax=Limnochorda pilosa TaxID=1555112 RepID=A0A0K2SMT5_LIMPI|nr:alkaline shock response membrane anchor protein AmaP [Limnochorda pilosa]BAS28426.1 hypothetical protein LIP_2596 [Limnochorda pilosa]